jgi:hypothetical protein
MTALTDTRDVLIRGRALIADPDRWIKGRDHAIVAGRDCYCAAGALRSARVDQGLPEALRTLRHAAGPDAGTIPAWNDAPERTHAEVLAAFDAAIADVTDRMEPL